MTVFISTGEASGDAYGGALLHQIRRHFQVEAYAVGGPRLREAGATLVADSSHWGAISMVQAFKVAPRIYRGFRKTKRALSRIEPGLFIPIDFGYANIRLARFAKAKGWKVLYFIPPGSWRRDRQGKDLPHIADEIVTPFPWSAEILRGMGASAHFFGHPIKSLMGRRQDARGPGIAVLPGSRWHEISENVPPIAQALHDFQSPVEFAVSSSTDPERLRALWKRHAPGRTGDLFTTGDTSGVLSRGHAAIVCSGTATLEAALCRCPTVVVYRLTKAMEIEARLLGIRPKYISLPNILLDRPAVPELIQHDATPARIRAEVERLSADGEARLAQLRDFDELDELLGPENALERTAELAASMLRPTR